ncbi:uncharacterized protein CTHT_0049040 [Thermochaetoides thermophila DSM 1495]|uniref:Uncharacterized protein n=1 Tax=Chaetomium thermophilum (strain DSM 1495 / CBS 144.50 / IMI 039719) TaxID=759272 RepID=G0SB63_CHATD|nr:hypothetical protein CTHT_0049040 [Thermochaetoides thermophila DSM 1495]EGS19443.1 hypothetical protein CTHT_0049040 [Thermochaetoides thermophila DSM 1495]
MDKPSSLSFLRKKEKSKGRLSVNHVSRRQSFDPEELEKIRALTASDTAVEAQSNDSDLEHAEEFDPINPEGITLLHMPEDPQTHKVDIIFIHGLGGGSYRTWSYKTKPDKFWPKLWLPREVPEARIFTFGYDANVNVLRKGDDVSILDFAKTFLQRVKHYQEGTTQRFGQVPIIVVAHSMGGLVFKQAFVLGHMDPAFHDIIPMFRAVLFLATPHRGSDLAKVLSLFLSSGRTYVEELIRKSTTTDQLRESFRHLAPKLRIISFYETKPTPIALGISTMIVEKDNAILDYPGEESMMLAADHHQVCKFKSTNDNNYRIVIEKIRSVVMQLSSVPAQADTANVPHGDLQQNLDAELEEIAYMLGVEHHIGTPKADPDLLCRISERTDGTCINFLHDTRVENWLNTGKTEILWAYAPAGSGKSMTCAFFTDYLFQNYQHCSFFFFKYGQRARQSPQDMLLSLAYQTARQLPEYRRALLNLAKSGSSRARTLASLDWMAIRRQLFTGFLAPLKTAADLYWVVDGVDEGLSRDQIMRALTEVAADFKGPVKVHILVSSRPLEDIRQVIRVAKAREDKKKDGIIIDEMPFPDNRDDIRRTVDNELDYLPCDEEEHPTLKRDIVERIVDRADGNFLWARLISEKIVQECADYADIEHVLDTTPSGMSEFYDRMMGAIQKLNNNKDKTMAQASSTCDISSPNFVVNLSSLITKDESLWFIILLENI